MSQVISQILHITGIHQNLHSMKICIMSPLYLINNVQSFKKIVYFYIIENYSISYCLRGVNNDFLVKLVFETAVAQQTRS